MGGGRSPPPAVHPSTSCSLWGHCAVLYQFCRCTVKKLSHHLDAFEVYSLFRMMPPLHMRKSHPVLHHHYVCAKLIYTLLDGSYYAL